MSDCAVPPYGGDAPLLGGSGGGSAGLGAPSGGDGGAKFSFFNLKRYRKYFNVDTQVAPLPQPSRSPFLLYALLFVCCIIVSTKLHPAMQGRSMLDSGRQIFGSAAQDVLVRMRDSVIGAYKPDFLEKTSDSADLCARRCLLHTIACKIILQSLMRTGVPSAAHIIYSAE